MKQYKLTNNLMGWITFVIAAITYCLTIEPTASFWDCGEFITSSFKLEVGHPPGAPFFMLTANFFTQFTNDVTLVAKMVNYMSAIMSAFTILFLFWTITHLTKKLIVKKEESITRSKLITIMGSGLVGALVYAFSDTFWFSAVEAEVYAYSSLFTALVFWLILKWEDVANEPHSDRWLVLIAYLTGLSIGVHLLNLLCIPAIVLVYYYKKKPNATAKGSLLALFAAFILIAVVMYGIIPGVVKMGGWSELLFINVLGFSFNTGLIIYLIVLAGVLVWGIFETFTQKSSTRMNIAFLATILLLGIPFYGNGVSSVVIGILVLGALAFYLFSKSINEKYKITARVMNTCLLCIMTIMVGYSSYALIVIRSAANTPMDQNSPEDIFTLGYYLSREQYGDRPLFYGQTFASEVEVETEGNMCVPVTQKGSPVYVKREVASTANSKDEYVNLEDRFSYVYAQNVFFPRMYSSAHTEQYKSWTNMEGQSVSYSNPCQGEKQIIIPTAWENVKFFFNYQLNFMYWRYFMWNFAGRQNDNAGSGEIENGNWITGFNFIDKHLVGDQTKLPSEMATNKGHNVYYLLPLLLGIIGILYQSNRGLRGIQGFWVVFFLFFMTGIAIVLYLNQTPSQPRERDYAYAGSFYAFSIWIGMGVAGLVHLLKKRLNETTSAIIATLAALCVPIQMVSQTWDDHDRSGRTFTRDIGQNYLMSCQEEGNPIIFTNGDNDTFPLWYNQEVEGFRTDVRVCNLSYLQTDWYIDQMKRIAYKSKPLPISWERYQYVQGVNDFVYIRPELKSQLTELYQKNPEYARDNFGENPFEWDNIVKHFIFGEQAVIPTDSIVIKVDAEAVKRSGMLIPDSIIPEYLTISLKGKRGLYKHELMLLQMISQNKWQRPIYYAITVGGENHMSFGENFIQEGLTYRVTPFNTQKSGARIDAHKMYDNLMHKFKWGGVDSPTVYLDENHIKMCSSLRRLFVIAAETLYNEGEKEKSLTLLDYSSKVLPAKNIPHNIMYNSLDMADLYAKMGKKKQAEEILMAIATNASEYLEWYLSLSDTQFANCIKTTKGHLEVLMYINSLLKEMDSTLLDKTYKTTERLYSQYNTRTGGK